MCNKKKYRGIDREVYLCNLGHVHKDNFDNVLNQYIKYLFLEGEYTEENLSTVVAFSAFINENCGKSEVIAYSSSPVSEGSTWLFLGIDIIDEHLKSVLKSRFFSIKFKNVLNSNNLFNDIEAASKVLKKREWLHPVYVYCLQN
jgi:hypothetical protein